MWEGALKETGGLKEKVSYGNHEDLEGVYWKTKDFTE